MRCTKPNPHPHMVIGLLSMEHPGNAAMGRTKMSFRAETAEHLEAVGKQVQEGVREAPESTMGYVASRLEYIAEVEASAPEEEHAINLDHDADEKAAPAEEDTPAVAEEVPVNNAPRVSKAQEADDVRGGPRTPWLETSQIVSKVPNCSVASTRKGSGGPLYIA